MIVLFPEQSVLATGASWQASKASDSSRERRRMKRRQEKQIMEALLKTDTNNSILTLQRALLGAVMFPHGAQKLLGWFGGYGFDGTMKFFTDTLHVPAPLALLVILAESVGSLLLIAGLGTRLAA